MTAGRSGCSGGATYFCLARPHLRPARLGGGRGDFNSIDTNPAALSGTIRRRRMTAHSDQIYSQLGFMAAGGGALAGSDLLPIPQVQAGAAANGYLTSSVAPAQGLGAL